MTTRRCGALAQIGVRWVSRSPAREMCRFTTASTPRGHPFGPASSRFAVTSLHRIGRRKAAAAGSAWTGPRPGLGQPLRVLALSEYPSDFPHEYQVAYRQEPRCGRSPLCGVSAGWYPGNLAGAPAWRMIRHRRFAGCRASRRGSSCTAATSGSAWTRPVRRVGLVVAWPRHASRSTQRGTPLG
jgi:hypothetical protein